MSYFWVTQTQVKGRGYYRLLQACQELGICKLTVRDRSAVEVRYFFAGELEADEPRYSLPDILREAEYRKALRERDLIEAEAAGGVEL